MKNMLTMGATGLMIFAGLGWYLDWYKVKRVTNPDGHQSITIDLNTKRIQGDIDKGREKVGGYLGSNQPFNPQVPGSYPSPQQPQYNPTSFQQPPQTNPYPAPQQGYPQQQQQGYPVPGYPQGQSNWAPAVPTSNQPQQGGGFIFPGSPSNPPAQPAPPVQQNTSPFRFFR